MRRARAWHSTTMLPDGRLLIFGGIGTDGNVLRDGELLDPATGVIEELSPAGLTARARHTATLLTDGRVLIAGGISDKTRFVSRAQLWDSQTQKVRSTSSISISRQNHQATLLPDGNVLIEGGSDSTKNKITTAELFNVEAESFSVTTITGQDDGQTPFLTGSIPVDGAAGVPVDRRIALRFSKRVPVDAIKSATIKLQGPGDTVAVRIVPAEDGRLSFVSPLQRLMKGATYTVVISGPKDGSVGVTPGSVSFTTEIDNLNNSLAGDLDWNPTDANMHGNWRTNYGRSKWQDELPLQAGPGETALSGQVLTLTGEPLPNVTISVPERSTRTDSSGRFLLSAVKGHHVMLIDGRTARQPGRTFGIFRVGVDITEGLTNVLPYTIWMPKLDMAHAVSIPSPTNRDMVITNPRVPGLELRLPAGTVIRGLDGQPVTQISITPVPTDRPPFPIPAKFNVPVFATIQPGGAFVIPPRATLIYPNFIGAPPGRRISFWTYEPEGRGWYSYGKGTVSPNGKQIVPDPGVVIYQFNGIMHADNDDDVADKAPNTSGGGDPCKTSTIGCGGGRRGGGGGGNNANPGGSKNPGGNNPNGGGPGAGNPGGSPGGDPVDLATGIFVDTETDIYLPDTIPISVTRTYRTLDTIPRPFGIGSTLPYEMFLTSTNNYNEVDLILPDSNRIHYVRISPGTGFTDAVYEHTETPTVFYKSRISWNGAGGWDVALTDGTVLVFPELLPLQAIRDRYGNQVTITRAISGVSGNITQVTSPNGKWLKFTYDGSNRITQVQDNMGRTVGYTYDGSGRLWKKTDQNGGITEYTYDTSHRMLTIEDPGGNVYLTNEYDANGRVSEQTLADSSTYEFDYTLNGSGEVASVEITDPRGNVRSVTFNGDGHEISASYGVGTADEQTYTYERSSGSNIVTTITDALDRETEFTRDAQGFLTEVTLLPGTADEVSWQYTYEPNYHMLASVTDPLNHTTTYTYDAKGSVTSVTDPLNHSTTFTYDVAGQLKTVTDALNHTTEFFYDGGDLVAVEDPLGRTVNMIVDSVGRTLRATDPLGQSVAYAYDVLDRVTQVTDPLSGTVAFTYDANNNLTTVTDPSSGVLTYTYDNMERIINREDQLNNDTVYAYNSDGTVESITDRKGQVTSYTYDALDRLTEVTYDDSSTTTYTYDDANRITEIVDSISGTTEMSYDNFDQFEEITTPQGTIAYTYDDAGRRTSMTVSGQSAVNYTYDNANRLTQITKGSSTATFTYDNANRRTSLTPPGGATTEYTYDDASQVTELTYKFGATTLGNLTYTYDAGGRRTAIGGSYARTGQPAAVTSTTYNDANQATAFAGQTLTYDSNGNMTGDGTYTYTWNARNKLASISGTSFSASFTYDVFGRRTSKTVNGTTTSYLYDGSNLVQEQSGGSATANMVMGGLDEVLARTDSTTSWSLLTDALGSTLALVNSSGSVQTEYTYEPFGKTTTSGSSNANPSQFTGRENDVAGLYFYRNRYYSPYLHRFISEDPAGLRGGINSYAYVGNNPLSFSDPYGLKPKKPDTCDSDGGDIAQALREFVEAGKGNLDRVVFVAGFEGGGAIAAERMAARQLLTGLVGPLSQAEKDAVSQIPRGLLPDILNGLEDHTALSPLQQQGMAKKYLDAALNPKGGLNPAGVREFNIARANCVINGIGAPGSDAVKYMLQHGIKPKL
ncbi:MAG TPA: RHS repeat-associated core domain-containing protein [Pyrinomonadaceae bacterium]